MFQSVIPIETGFAVINLLQLLTIGTSDNTALVCPALSGWHSMNPVLHIPGAKRVIWILVSSVH